MRRRLVIVSLAVTSIVALAFLVPLAGLVRELARDRVLTAAERDAELVAQFAAAVDDGAGFAGALAALGVGEAIKGHPVSVVLPDGTVEGAPVPPGEDLTLPKSGAAGSLPVVGGEAVYVPILSSGGEIAVVRVFVPESELTENVTRSWLILGGLGLLLVLIAVLVADRLGRSLVKPVEELSDAAERLGDGDLSVRVEPSGPPELVEVGTEFNHLARRVTQLLQAERESAADLSHRLRTPLTAARLDAENLPPGPDRDRLVADLDDMERTVDHIIREARRPVRQDAAGLTDVVAVTENRARFWQALADEQGRRSELIVKGQASAMVHVSEADFEAAIDALIGNVLGHTPEGTAYAVSILTSGTKARIVVEDAGSGLGAEPPIGRGESGTGSTGLGLDIVQRTVLSAGGALHTGRSPLGGARIEMALPTPDRT